MEYIADHCHLHSKSLRQLCHCPFLPKAIKHHTESMGNIT